MSVRPSKAPSALRSKYKINERNKKQNSKPDELMARKEALEALLRSHDNAPTLPSQVPPVFPSAPSVFPMI